MNCRHPYCPMGHGAADWKEVVNSDALRARQADKTELLANLSAFRTPATPSVRLPSPTSNSALRRRLLHLCPCLYNQIDTVCSPAGVIHLCELTLKTQITSANVSAAFDIQHPDKSPPFLFEPSQPCNNAGGIMENLCSEVLDLGGHPNPAI